MRVPPLLFLLLFTFKIFGHVAECPVVFRELAQPVYGPLYRFGGKLYKVYTRARFKEDAQRVATAAKQLSQFFDVLILV